VSIIITEILLRLMRAIAEQLDLLAAIADLLKNLLGVD